MNVIWQQPREAPAWTLPFSPWPLSGLLSPRPLSPIATKAYRGVADDLHLLRLRLVSVVVRAFRRRRRLPFPPPRFESRHCPRRCPRNLRRHVSFHSSSCRRPNAEPHDNGSHAWHSVWLRPSGALGQASGPPAESRTRPDPGVLCELISAVTFPGVCLEVRDRWVLPRPSKSPFSKRVSTYYRRGWWLRGPLAPAVPPANCDSSVTHCASRSHLGPLPPLGLEPKSLG